ncbi:hypothetical protein V3C99_013785 [Haemonchus contortus]
MRGSPVQGRHRGATKLVRKPRNVWKTRVATLNVGTLTGRLYELAEALERRRIDFCAVQETRWSCCKSRDIGLSFKAVLCGGPKTTNGVGIIVSERYRDSIVSAERFDDRLMKIMVVIECQEYHLFSAYAPQTGCSEQTKDAFWNLLDEKTAEVPLQEAIVVAGDLNGHAPRSRARDRRKDSFYETVATQHRPLICTLKIAPPKSKLAERCGPARIKWWRLKEKEAAVVSSILLPAVTTVEETWKGAAEAITRVARSKLGMTKPGRRKLDKQTWLWTDHVKDKVREKKKQYHAFLIEKTDDNWQRYQIAKKEAKKAVASEKAAHYAELIKKLESREGERYVYRLAKNRNRQTEDIGKFFGINDENGHLLTDRRQTLERWREYFANISTIEFAHPAILCAPPVQGPVQKITVNETIAALKKMKSGKATGPDDLAADLWKSKGWNPTEWLTEFFNQVVAEKKVPERWQQSTTIPIWKKKGSPGDCTCFRPIRLLSHSMKIFERIVDSRIRDIVELTTNQCGFVAGCSTIDAIQATRLLLEKHREKRRPIYLAFLDLEKAIDRVPRDVIWYALRQHGVPEELIE